MNSRYFRNKNLWLILFIVFSLIFLVVYNKISKHAVEGWTENVKPYPNSEFYDIQIKKNFLSANITPIRKRYDKLFEYFLDGFINYKSQHGALVYYPGAKSHNGYRINALEGFARFFPVGASYLLTNKDYLIELDGKTVKLSLILREAILQGTNSKSSEYWGNIEDFDQRIVEASDIALGLWISHELIWDTYNGDEKDQIFKWLGQVANKKVVNNNWVLFPILITKSMQALGANIPNQVENSEKLFALYKSKNYVGEGWFDDDPNGEDKFDYYNAWAIHYNLFWLHQMDPSFDSDFIKKTNGQFIDFYRYFFSRKGFPMMGRSTCYRIAAPVPILTGVLLSPQKVSPGFALNTLDSTWKYFIENNALKNGKVTQGFMDTDLSILDGYSGPGSCLWSLRSLVITYYLENQISFFDYKMDPLPIEVADYVVENKSIGWKVTGIKKTQEIVLEISSNYKNIFKPITKYSISNRFKELIFRFPNRPNNHEALYRNKYYSNDNNIYRVDHLNQLKFLYSN